MGEYCRYSKYVQSGLDQYLWCTHSNKYCKYQRFCRTRKRVVHTDKYRECTFLQIREEKMEEEIVKTEIETIEKPEVIKKEKPAKKEQKKEKAVVVLATPNFYIVEKDGHKFKKVQANSYKKGDIVKL